MFKFGLKQFLLRRLFCWWCRVYPILQAYFKDGCPQNPRTVAINSAVETVTGFLFENETFQIRNSNCRTDTSGAIHFFLFWGYVGQWVPLSSIIYYNFDAHIGDQTGLIFPIRWVQGTTAVNIQAHAEQSFTKYGRKWCSSHTDGGCTHPAALRNNSHLEGNYTARSMGCGTPQHLIGIV